MQGSGTILANLCFATYYIGNYWKIACFDVKYIVNKSENRNKADK